MITIHDIIMRTIVDLPNEQVKKLALVCRKEKMLDFLDGLPAAGSEIRRVAE